MSLTTRCPNCGTAFRVQPIQLSARGGKVRCGRCANVFDGVAALIEEGAAPANAPDLPDSEPSPQLALFEPAKKLPPGAAGDAANEDAPLADFLDEPPPPKRRVLWALGALLALAALAAQAALYFRTELAVRIPEARPHLQAVCAMLGCQVRLPRNSKLILIESSELKNDDSLEGVVRLDATFRNLSPLAQEYPMLMLTLMNADNEVLVAKAIAPREYLRPKEIETIDSGLQGGSVAEAHVRFDNSKVNAISYRLSLVYM